MSTLRKLNQWLSFSDCVFCAATGALGYGIFQIHPPSAFIILGVLFIVLTTYGRFK